MSLYLKIVATSSIAARSCVLINLCNILSFNPIMIGFILVALEAKGALPICSR